MLWLGWSSPALDPGILFLRFFSDISIYLFNQLRGRWEPCRKQQGGKWIGGRARRRVLRGRGCRITSVLPCAMPVSSCALISSSAMSLRSCSPMPWESSSAPTCSMMGFFACIGGPCPSPPSSWVSIPCMGSIHRWV